MASTSRSRRISSKGMGRKKLLLLTKEISSRRDIITTDLERILLDMLGTLVRKLLI